MNETKDVKITFFKESGKYYTEDTVKVPASIDQVFQVVDWLEANVKVHKDMHLVAMLDEYGNGYPIMIPAGRRG